MASVKQRPSGAWQAKVRRLGFPDQSKTFARKTDAEAWARAVEREMDVGSFVSRNKAENTTFGDAVDRYLAEVVPKLRAQRQPTSMLLKLKERFGEYSLVAIQPSMLAAYRDERLRAVGPQTVTHELGLVNRVFKACQLDWGIPLPQGIPTAGIRKPKLPPGRDRRLEGDEEAILLRSLGQSATPWMKAAFVLAIETAARRSELLSLAWQEVDLTRRVARIRGVDGRATKNDQRYRDVPLSTRAVATLAQLPRSTTGRVLPITADALDSAWDRLIARCRREHVHGVLTRKLEEQGIDAAREIRALVYKRRAPLDITLKLLAEVDRVEVRFLDLHWHDLRHEAVSRLAERLQMHELMKVTGQKTAKMLARYYHPRAEDLAAKLG